MEDSKTNRNRAESQKMEDKIPELRELNKTNKTHRLKEVTISCK